MKVFNRLIMFVLCFALGMLGVFLGSPPVKAQNVIKFANAQTIPVSNTLSTSAYTTSGVIAIGDGATGMPGWGPISTQVYTLPISSATHGDVLTVDQGDSFKWVNSPALTTLVSLDERTYDAKGGTFTVDGKRYFYRWDTTFKGWVVVPEKEVLTPKRE